MRAVLNVLSKTLLELFSALLIFAALILIALAVFGSGEAVTSRLIYAIGGIAAIPISLILLAIANPKDTEGSLIFILLSLINWPR